MRYRFVVAIVAAIVAALGLLAYRSHLTRDVRFSTFADARVLAADAVDPSITYSNILPADYVGPQACAKCHQEQYDNWQNHPHHNMNQLPDAQSVIGDFDDSRLALPSGQVEFSTDPRGRYWMTVNKDGRLHRRYAVTRTVGSRFQQFYIGKQTEGPEPPQHAIYREHMLPFAYWLKIKRWYPRQYFDSDGEETLIESVPQVEAVNCLPDVRAYSDVCMNCHNTFAYAFRIYRDDLVGFPSATVKAAIDPLSRALSDTIRLEPTADAFYEANARLDPDRQLVTLGISCESCHFGGRQHALHEEKIRFLPTSKYIRLDPRGSHPPLTDDHYNAPTVNGICAQCHSGNGRLYANGAGQANSREALDMHAGFCASQLRCVDCHEPHTATTAAPGSADNPKHLQLCIQCHDQFADPADAQTHAGHPAAAAINCLDCHMPRYTQGLDELIRTHRICMPLEASMVEAASVNACNLCHLDKSLRWTLQHHQRIWGRTVATEEELEMVDDPDAPLGQVWLHSGDPQLRLVATQSYARSPWAREMLPELIRALNDPEPLNRVFAGFAVSRLLDRPLDEPLEVDLAATPADRAAQIRAWLEQLPSPEPAGGGAQADE